MVMFWIVLNIRLNINVNKLLCHLVPCKRIKLPLKLFFVQVTAVSVSFSFLFGNVSFPTGIVCRLQVAGWNLIITGKLLALKIINNPYTGQGFLHKVVCVSHSRKHDRSAISTYWLTRWNQWNLFKAIWMAAPQTFPSIPDLGRVFPQQQKTAITNEANK